MFLFQRLFYIYASRMADLASLHSFSAFILSFWVSDFFKALSNSSRFKVRHVSCYFNFLCHISNPITNDDELKQSSMKYSYLWKKSTIRMVTSALQIPKLHPINWCKLIITTCFNFARFQWFKAAERSFCSAVFSTIFKQRARTLDRTGPFTSEIIGGFEIKLC